VILFALALATLPPAFDCAKAATDVERMICSDEELAALDRAVSRLYSGVRRSRRASLNSSQPNWLKERDACTDKDCLVTKYDDRLFDLFGLSRTPMQKYASAPVNGSLSLLDVGGGWFAFRVIGLWIGPGPGPTNDTMEIGHFKLVRGKAEQPAIEQDCGWRIERLSRDRWFVEELPYEKEFVGCGGWNATLTGVYSR